jgi:hypothetical protein
MQCLPTAFADVFVDVGANQGLREDPVSVLGREGAAEVVLRDGGHEQDAMRLQNQGSTRTRLVHMFRAEAV